ncbi:MAG: zf-HC2 domain-containing protein [Acidobacteriia bacterium]|nr:zf-HC2 domain-containing protein [Terriglobia bacterium]
MNTHEQYEELCALAASGQASPDELTDLRAHLENCPSCRSAAYDFTQISAQALSQLAGKRLHCQIPSGMTQRFVARARSEGVEMTRENVPKTMPTNRRALFLGIGAVAAVILIAGFLMIGKQRSSPTAGDHRQLPGYPTTVPSPSVPPQNAQAQDNGLQQQLASARAEVNSMGATMRAQRTELESVSKTRDSLNSRLTEAQQENARIQSERVQLEARTAGLEAEVAKSRSEKNAGDVALTLQEAELRKLRNRLADQAAALGQQEDLAARGSDVRDLVVARNLHIIDVHDRDGDGKSQRAFGRIFYTEGKSLIFYAYDLADPRKLDAKVSFYVWGERLGAEKPIRSLGIFHNDDVNDGRWVLTFGDPQVLAQINSVFVTVESSRKAVKKPGGRRILFAFLGDKPNHP